MQPKCVTTAIMAIINATPDSYFSPSRIVDQSATMCSYALQYITSRVAEGADLLDVGGESSRPNAISISVEEEIQRICPVIELIRSVSPIPISIDTVKPQVAQKAIELGANIINDINGFTDPDMRECLVSHPNVQAIIMHMQGTPQTMQNNPMYPHGVVNEVYTFFSKQLELLESYPYNIDTKERIILDPGIGFGKTLDDNIQLMQAVPRLKTLGCKLLYGVSRKAWIEALLCRKIDDRLPSTLAAAAFLISQHVDMIRVHDVQAHVDLKKILYALSSFR